MEKMAPQSTAQEQREAIEHIWAIMFSEAEFSIRETMIKIDRIYLTPKQTAILFTAVSFKLPYDRLPSVRNISDLTIYTKTDIRHVLATLAKKGVIKVRAHWKPGDHKSKYKFNRPIVDEILNLHNKPTLRNMK